LEDLIVSVTTALEPDQERKREIRLRVDAYLRARRSLEGEGGMRDLLFAALRQRGPRSKLVAIGDDLFGLVPVPPDDDTVTAGAVPDAEAAGYYVLVIDPEALRLLVEGQADARLLDPQGLAFHLVEQRDPPAANVAATRPLGAAAGLPLPYRAELLWVRPPALPAEGPAELFYWGIILLAAGGLGMGGTVLSRLYAREVRLARLKADFVSNLSHELKTPLTSIGLFAEMLQEGQLQTEEERREGLDVLAQEAQRLQGIVARMLETARREARGVPYELRPGDLNQVVAEATERFRRIVTEPGLDLKVDLHDGPMPMLMDEAAMNDVATNLLTNAWKYRRGDEAEIRVHTGRRGRQWLLVVDDDGIGIPRRDRRRVFEMFYRSDAYLTKVAGTGLGLSLVRTIVRAHKGRIRVEGGERGHGSRFRIAFPIAKVAPRASTSSAGPVGSSPRTRSEAQTTA
jgi:signal transduction histidine kinase